MTSAVIVEADVDPRAWNEFVASSTGDVLSQSTMWGDVKAPGYRSIRIAASRNGHLVAGAQVLVRDLPGRCVVAYVPKGPVSPEHDLVATAAVLDRLDQIAGRCRATVSIVQPPDSWPALDRLLAARGYGASPVDVATTATVEVGLGLDDTALFSGLRSSLRRNIRKAERAGVEVRRGDGSDLAPFHALHCATGRRQAFEPMTLGYIERQWQRLHPVGAMEVFIAERAGEAVSAATVSCFGDRVVFKLAGWSGTAAALRPNDLLHWRILQWAREAGYAYYDLGGFDRAAAVQLVSGRELPSEFRSGHSQFKLGFGGRLVVLPRAVWRAHPAPLRLFQPLGRRMFSDDSAPRRAVARLRSS